MSEKWYGETRHHVTGTVSYEVEVDCPKCGKTLYLNQYPYDDDETDYGHQNNELGLLVFGGEDTLAQWQSMNLTYRCCGCKTDFVLDGIEY